MIPPDSCRTRIDLRPRLIEGPPALQPTNHNVCARKRVRAVQLFRPQSNGREHIRTVRQSDQRVHLVPTKEAQVGRRYSYDGMRPTLQQDPTAEDVRGCREMTPPERITENHD